MDVSENYARIGTSQTMQIGSTTKHFVNGLSISLSTKQY